IRLRGYCLELPGTVRSVVSLAAGFGGGVVPGGTGGGGGAIAYAQSGGAVVAARTATVTSRGNAARTTSAANLRIKSLHSNNQLWSGNYRRTEGEGGRGKRTPAGRICSKRVALIIYRMKTFVFRILLTLATFGPVSAALAQTAPAEPKNYGIDPWHINVPKPVANPVTSVTE